jgi:prevent-host-death family protein
MPQIELSQAQLNLADLLNKALQGEEIILTENNQPILRLTRITEPKPGRRLGQATGEVWMAADFNETYEEWIADWEPDLP